MFGQLPEADTLNLVADLAAKADASATTSALAGKLGATAAAGGDLTGNFPNPDIAAGAVGGAEIAAAIKDPAAATAGLRTLGTGAAQALPGNHASTTDSRAPNGSAGGALTGSYPDPDLAVVPHPPVALTDAATVAVNAALGTHFRLLMTSGVGATRAMGAPSNPSDGQKILFEIKQDATGSRAVTWNAVYRFGTLVTQPVITVTASKKDYVGFVYNATDVKWDCLAVSPGY
jgi:hypothetical protein